MSALLAAPRLARSAPPPSASSAPSIDLEARLTSAVREGATRAAVAAGLGAIAAIHAVDAVGKWTETRYMFWMYIAAIVAAVAVAGATLFSRSRLALAAAAGVAGSVLLGYVADRTIGLPSATGDIGNWTEPLGLASVVVEAVTIAVAIGGLLMTRSARGLAR
jgi:hypothetical protein